MKRTKVSEARIAFVLKQSEDGTSGGAGVALLPAAMFTQALNAGTLVQLFDVSLETGCYWLTRLKTRMPSLAMTAFRDWLIVASEGPCAAWNS